MIGRLKSLLDKQSPPTRTKEYANRVFEPDLVLSVDICGKRNPTFRTLANR